MRSTALAVVVLLVVCLNSTAAPVCGVDSLSKYEALEETGCTVGIFTLKSFDFDVLAFPDAGTSLRASDIQVTPELIGSRLMINFSSPGFSVVGSEFARYEVSYIVDPPPIIFRIASQMTTLTPVAPGRADVFTTACATVGVVCPPGTIADLHVFHAGTTSKLTDQVFVPFSNYVALTNLIELDANGASADFASLSNEIGFVPEPASIGFVVGGLMCLAGSGFLRNKLAAKAN